MRIGSSMTRVILLATVALPAALLVGCGKTESGNRGARNTGAETQPGAAGARETPGTPGAPGAPGTPGTPGTAAPAPAPGEYGKPTPGATDTGPMTQPGMEGTPGPSTQPGMEGAPGPLGTPGTLPPATEPATQPSAVDTGP